MPPPLAPPLSGPIVHSHTIIIRLNMFTGTRQRFNFMQVQSQVRTHRIANCVIYIVYFFGFTIDLYTEDVFVLNVSEG